ncbi:MAG: hypothetical protein ABI068_14345 [Ktedonobacterales bacterium]
MQTVRRIARWCGMVPLCLSLTLLMLAGCGVTTHAPTGNDPGSTAAATPAPTLTPTLAPLTMQQAWGNVAVTTLTTDLDDNRVFIFAEAASPDGQWLVGGDSSRDFPTIPRPSYLALYNVRTRRVVLIQALQHPNSAIIAASIDAHWLAWTEAPETTGGPPGPNDWQMFLYNHQTDTITRRIQSPDGEVTQLVNDTALFGATSGPVVSGDAVIWSQPTSPIVSNTDNPNKIAVKIENLTTGVVTTLATGAQNVALSWPWAMWIQIVPNYNPDGGDVTFRNMLTGQTIPLHLTGGVALDGVSIAYDAPVLPGIGNSGAVMNLVPDITRSTQPQQIAAAPSITQPYDAATSNDRLVTWYENDPQMQVWDRVEKRLVALPLPSQAGGGWVGGRILLWVTPAPGPEGQPHDGLQPLQTLQTLNLVDTATLPTTAPKD